MSIKFPFVGSSPIRIFYLFVSTINEILAPKDCIKTSLTDAKYIETWTEPEIRINAVELTLNAISKYEQQTDILYNELELQIIIRSQEPY